MSQEENKEPVRVAPIYRSLHRPPLVMGGDRDLVLTSGLFCFLTGFGGMTVFSGVSSALVWFGAMYALRRMAKKDPHMFKVWLRHKAKQSIYHAKATPWQNLAWKK